MNVLYLFSGAQRKSSVTAVLQQMCSRQGIQCVVHDVDIQNSAAWDLSKAEVQARLLAPVKTGEFDVVLITPPCSTWSRVRGANCRGPPMIRSRQYVWGFPWLSSRHSRDAELGNALVLFMLDVLDALEVCPISQNGATVLVFAEHPEDLGVAYREEDRMRMDPASIWQLPRLQGKIAPASALGLFTVVFNQRCWGAPYRKPTRSLSNLSALRQWGACRWPEFDSHGHYAGPQLQCSCHPTVTLARTSTDADFRTSTTSAYPVAMDQALAEAILDQWLLPLQAKEGEVEGGKKSKLEGKKDPKKRRLESMEEASSKGASTSTPPAGTSKRTPVAPGVQRPGAGPPIQVSYKGETRALHDGAGLCSPGRWPVDKRRDPASQREMSTVGWFQEAFKLWLETVGEEEAKGMFWKMAAGKVLESPRWKASGGGWMNISAGGAWSHAGRAQTETRR